MQTHLVINGKDYTPYIVEGSYKINVTEKSSSWEDGNMVTHKIIVSSKVTGSVRLLCSEQGSWPRVSTLNADLNAATDNGVLTLGVYVPSKGAFEAIDCYYSLESADHIKANGGLLTDVLELKITER